LDLYFFTTQTNFNLARSTYCSVFKDQKNAAKGRSSVLHFFFAPESLI